MAEQDGLLECFKKLYPKVDHSETPLPVSWNPREKYNYLGLSSNNLRVHYKGGPGKSLKDSASVRASHPIPAACGIYYFEVKVICKGKNGYIGVGLSDKSAPLSRLPGWDKCSYGYHADDGKAFCGSSNAGEDYGPTFTTGDVIGCGLNFVDRTIFYTKNGIHLGTAFRDVPTNTQLFPTVGLQTHGEVVEANFGGSAFLFDFQGLLVETRQKMLQTIQQFPVGCSEAKWQTQIHKLVLDYLTVHGFSATAEAFAKSTGQKLNESVSSIRNRQRIQSLVLSGRISEAIRTTQTLYPGLLESKPELLFQLKCRQFVEMIAGTDTEGIMSDAGSGMGSPVGVSGARSHASLSPTHSSRPSSCIGSQPGSPHTVTDPISPSSPTRAAPAMESTGNGHVTNGVNGSSVSLDQGEMEQGEEDEEEEEMELTEQRQHHSPPALDLTGLPCGGNRMAIERLLFFGQDLHVMLQQLPPLPSGQREQLQTQLQDAFSLIAYADVKSCPLSHLLAHSQRAPIGQALNACISGHLHLPVCSPLELSLGHNTECLRVLSKNSHGEAGLVGVQDVLEHKL